MNCRVGNGPETHMSCAKGNRWGMAFAAAMPEYSEDCGVLLRRDPEL